jgi:hypothetical protein
MTMQEEGVSYGIVAAAFGCVLQILPLSVSTTT